MSDKSLIRKKSLELGEPIVELLLKVINEPSYGTGWRATLLGICPVSQLTIRAAIESASLHDFPLMFVATLNQVDIDGGYTGLTPKDFVDLVRVESERVGFKGPTIICLDHGGPWLKDKHVVERLKLEEALEQVEKSIEACIKAGYDLLHIDATADIWLERNKTLDMDTIVERTIDLIEYAEGVREKIHAPRVSYEVGTEEIYGGVTSPRSFKKFIVKLKEGLKNRGLEDVWPCFIVGNVGTFLAPTNRFNSNKARTLVKIAKSQGLYLKGHFTDYVSNPNEYPKAGIGAANIGPELAHAEYRALEELAGLEMTFFRRGHVSQPSNIIEKLNEAVIRSGKWKKWLRAKEHALEFHQLPQKRRNWLLGTGARYFFSSSELVEAKTILRKNFERYGIDAERVIIAKIRDVLWKYIHAFNLKDLTYEVNSRLLKQL
ncbi:MAG: class II D-tagatose-bisphosphate aldolase, non-catalytic subunit [Aigarchaeota archaeon]|nr:class II D-tagatose-bisphosphate aldolase, non-catalytic subunit [Candidatus Calditenuaceae archaeon]